MEEENIQREEPMEEGGDGGQHFGENSQCALHAQKFSVNGNENPSFTTRTMAFSIINPGVQSLSKQEDSPRLAIFLRALVMCLPTSLNSC